jgi:hypothetical protein
MGASDAALAHAVKMRAAIRTKPRDTIFFMTFSFSSVGDFSIHKDAQTVK